jgi:hydrogenase maturation protease
VDPVTANGSEDPTPKDDVAAPHAKPGAAVRIVGCGRNHRRDDQVGIRVANRLMEFDLPNTWTQASEAPGADLLVDLEGVRLLVLIDAARCGERLAAGEIRRLAVPQRTDGNRVEAIQLPNRPHESSHLLGAVGALAVGEELGILPPNVWIYIIGGEEFGYGDELAPGPRAAVERAAERIAADVRDWLEREESGHA